MVRPTPTQEENDRSAKGEYIFEHEDDGSGPDLHLNPLAKHLEAGKPAAQHYQTRTHTAPRTKSE